MVYSFGCWLVVRSFSCLFVLFVWLFVWSCDWIFVQLFVCASVYVSLFVCLFVCSVCWWVCFVVFLFGCLLVSRFGVFVCCLCLLGLRPFSLVVVG